MKRIFALIGVATGAFTLTGCDLNNTEMENIIQKCKEDVECKAILDREIDEALNERGIFANDSEDPGEYEIFYDLDLTEEEQELLEALENLENEVWETFEGMSEEEVKELELREFESMLGRELTTEELAALSIVDELWNTEVEYVEFETELEYLVHYLGRELTQEELDAFAVIEGIEWENFDDETGEVELTPEQEAAFDIIDNLYMEMEDHNELDEIEVILGRALTQEELDAIQIVEDIDWESQEYDPTGEFELTPEQEAAFDIIDELHEELEANYEVYELNKLLGRELTDDEIAALQTVDNLYIEIESNFDFDYEDYNEVEEMVRYYETILDRELTDLEKEAIEFSLEFYFYEDVCYEDECYYDEFYYDEDFEEYYEDEYYEYNEDGSVDDIEEDNE